MLGGCAVAPYADFSSTPVYENSFKIDAVANHTAGRGYADACFEIGAARRTIQNGHAYFIILDQSLTNTPTTDTITSGGFEAGGVFIPATSTSSTANFWTKTGTIKTFGTKPDSEYVIPYNALLVLKKWSAETLNMCGW